MKQTTPTTNPKLDDDTIVKADDERPAGKGSGVCLYCKEKIGQPHKWECVIPQKQVMVKMTVEYPISVPRSWGKEDIEFQRNEGSWCASNAVDELKALGDCICNYTAFAYVGVES